MKTGELQVDYCPVSQSIDLLGDRWTLGVIFHILLGRTRFSELCDVMPRLPRATLSKRLKLLVRAEIITRTETDDGRVLYAPTPAGAELYDVLYGLGVWGERWIREIITDDAVDPAKIMWDIRRMLDAERMPTERVVVHFVFVGVPPAQGHFWMVLDRDAPDLCVVDPGFGDDLVVRSRPGPIGAMWMGDRTLADLVTEGAITVTGLPRLVRELPAWIGTSVFGDIDRAVGRVRRSPVATP
jgi:DNA-binding HxlR family transcriptional regulator